MIGLVIVAHGTLADALLAATEHVVGRLPNAVAVAIGPHEDLTECQSRITNAVAAVDSGAGVAVVTDMFGGTPSNLAHGAMTSSSVEVVYGANLPLLVKLAKTRDRELGASVAAAIAAGRKYVNCAGAVLDPGKSA